VVDVCGFDNVYLIHTTLVKVKTQNIDVASEKSSFCWLEQSRILHLIGRRTLDDREEISDAFL
jgi:hypothetical protein